MSQTEPSRLDRLEALAETTLLAIRELSNRQERTQVQLNQFEERIQTQFQEFDARMGRLQGRLEDIVTQQAANAAQIAANSQQIALNTAGLLELRNLLADFVRNQNR